MTRATLISSATRRHWCVLYTRGQSADTIAETYGVSPQAVRNELRRRDVQIRNKGTREAVRSMFEPPAPATIHCGQCDHPVSAEEARLCEWRFCKAKEFGYAD